MGRQHDPQPIQRFFDGWSLYERVIQHDYMFHRPIHAALRQALETLGPRSLLDLGCGDASSLAHTLSGLEIESIVGVDLSPVALEHAAANLRLLDLEPTLVEDDYMRFLQRDGLLGDAGGAGAGDAEDAGVRHYDAVLAGYTVHHLVGLDVLGFLERTRALLNPGGALFIYDVFRLHDETREDNLARNHAWRQQNWGKMSAADLDAIWEHVSTADFPKSELEMAETAAKAGFPSTPELLFMAPTGIHRLYRFSTS